ncbi:MAG: lipocalin family protein [Thermodesulfobacteriota bacterium]|nr:lipocalin family protein [Thermodesulfobacteriota bacterium]
MMTDILNIPGWKDYVYSPPNSGILFPYDEGKHDLPFEWWFFTFNGEREDGNGYALELNYQINPSEVGGGERELCFVDKSNTKFYPLIKAGVFGADYGRLNLSFETGGGRDYWRQIPNRPFEYEIFANAVLEDGAKRIPFDVDLELVALKPPMVVDETKTEGAESYYYILPRLQVSGVVNKESRTFKINGIGWFDHQYFDPRPDLRILGWEWFSMNLDSGMDIIAYSIFDLNSDVIRKILFINHPEGTYESTEAFKVSYLDYWSPEAGDPYQFSSGWQISVDHNDIDLTIKPIIDDQLLRTHFWEGTCVITGHVGETGVDGNGYVELSYKHPVGKHQSSKHGA